MEPSSNLPKEENPIFNIKPFSDLTKKIDPVKVKSSREASPIRDIVHQSQEEKEREASKKFVQESEAPTFAEVVKEGIPYDKDLTENLPEKQLAQNQPEKQLPQNRPEKQLPQNRPEKQLPQIQPENQSKSQSEKQIAQIQSDKNLSQSQSEKQIAQSQPEEEGAPKFEPLGKDLLEKVLRQLEINAEHDLPSITELRGTSLDYENELEKTHDLPNMDQERESTVEAELKWEKEHDMLPEKKTLRYDLNEVLKYINENRIILEHGLSDFDKQRISVLKEETNDFKSICQEKMHHLHDELVEFYQKIKGKFARALSEIEGSSKKTKE